MRVLRQATLLFIAGLVIAAPMLCLQFCELQRYVARPRTSLAEMARLHALSLSERKSQRADHHGDAPAPLVRLKQMVNSVTEFLLALGLTIGASAIVLRFVILRLHLSEPVLAVPTPPPRPS
ncbi:MAG: hypothetical protein D6709_06425 [Chloroflexi bacterium]|jgi:hypothetical protein|uniref:Uncharacterized protein n=1 Tax=Candidatus Thermofonsia Clade 3 bacterium TaxID=2364212 RepID=A0A2M8QFV1_9CHLR|nr:hypothetical protein [Candidatus Roseilinea sp. NK_OTU-006]PJF48681.1 MAG: hypothetical protein CUN48_02175 [Candidatus Thermofonsia Clade 3 bacterium]RMG64113.1 MAG: hypothetical protein D6709_06425 [Chloroflexota bacterium]